jgi:hypothetical protein
MLYYVNWEGVTYVFNNSGTIMYKVRQAEKYPQVEYIILEGSVMRVAKEKHGY